MRYTHALALAPFLLLACPRAAAPPATLEAASSPNESSPDQVKADAVEVSVAAIVPSDDRHYCDAFPQNCRPCEGEPGSCGGEPVAGACCCEGNGCIGVSLAGECPVACDFYVCEWGYQDTDANGKPKFVCYD